MNEDFGIQNDAFPTAKMECVPLSLSLSNLSKFAFLRSVIICCYEFKHCVCHINEHIKCSA